jgi:transposase InsO family protein
MAWKETCRMEERMKLLVEYLGGDVSMSDLCRAYGVSRKTAYKWLGRYRSEGLCGLQDRSRAPLGHPQAVPEEIAAAIVAVRKRNKKWGPRKVRAWLVEHHPGICWPAASTIGVLFDREGLTKPRRWRRRVPARSAPLAHCGAPNDVWTADFKGWFRTGDGRRCDPLTLLDGDSRFLLRCRGLDGPPFASRAAGGLSRLAVKLIKAGVCPERIEPGKPQQNGRHERFHLTLKEETVSPPAANLLAQQRRFDEFQTLYNEQRPHEALGQKTPASRYRASPRVYSGRLRSPDYPDDHQIRRVRTSGEIKWRGQLVFISQVLVGEPVALEEQEDGDWTICYGPIDLGTIDHKRRFHKPRLWT